MGGFSFTKVMLIIGIVGALSSTGGSIIPKLYEYYLLRDLANRVVHDYADLSMTEVQRRVQFEINRSKISIPENSLHIFALGHGYRVTINYLIPLELHMGEKTFFLDGYEQWEFIYEVET